MNENEFDQFTRAVAAGGSRRYFLGLLGRSAVAGFLGLAGVTAMYAGRKKCPPGTFKCGKVCCDASGDLVCVNGTCCVPPHCP